ncbi:MAG: HAMP domain-containing sensor histidine kinase [Pseudomonadota bacterium]
MSAGLLNHLHNVIEAFGGRQQSVPDSGISLDPYAVHPKAKEELKATARSVVVDFNGIVTSVGRICAQQMPAVAPGIKLLDLVHVADRVAWMSTFSAFKNGCEDPVQLKINVAAPQKPQCFIQLRLAYESMEAGHIRLDISEDLSPAPSLTQRLPAEGDVLALMSHEFRTPLNAILGFSGLLNHSVSEGLKDAQKAEYVTLIHDAAEHMLGLVNGLLDVSKIGAGKYLIHQEMFSFREIVDEAASMLATKAAEKDIRLNLRTSLEDLGSIFADRRAIKQVLINLLSNAIKFTPENGCVTVDAWWEDHCLHFSVSDTGIGISEEEQTQLFTAFSQIDNGATRKSEGTGLGLCLVKGLVGLHGGDVTVFSSRHVGTRMQVHLPNARVEKRDRSRRITQADATGGSQDAFRQSA